MTGTVTPGHHGFRPLADVFKDKGAWIAFCHWCLENGQEPVITDGWRYKKLARAAADNHEFRHAGCDPRHILHILRVHGGARRELSVPEINGRLFGGMGTYSFWLLGQMTAREMVVREDRDGVRYYREKMKDDGQ